ncbi:glycosyltransferase 87 family protein [Paenibacillus sp. TRM 82003]|uniref:glycosyltransferase family 87 protein n=1 Tax=Kineococcus sp. TRM81007 TaxID=2925831 RepID=UPI001F56F845|nr:glycosyltransferase family 87 protein [Kineococcus sp. TRM81007]MCI2238202.1 glycosyltransferase 87 family protein [Kineococcus sp. TRM81007]MCI3924543.1 glycosyltransferase 87 family protein [Paenibacillus sp. TRM 82003]
MRPALRAAAPVALALVWTALALRTGWGAQAWQPGYDLAVYRHGAADLLAGADPYARVTERGHHFVYPPLAAALFTPLLLVPPGTGLLLWRVLLVAAALVLAVLALRAVRAPAAAVGWGGAALLVADPFREALVLGQISPLVVAALVLGCLAGGRGGAVLAALAGAVKVTPALVVAAAAAPAARRFAVRVAVAGVVLTLAGALVAPASWRSFFTDLLWDSSRVAPPGTISNNSLAGAFTHAGLGDAVAAPLALAGAVPLLVLVLVAARRTAWGEPAARLRFGLLVSIVTCLVSPVTWSHHALAAPLAAVVVAVAAPARVRVVALVALAPWLLPVLQAAADLGGAGGALLALTRPASLLVLTALLLPRAPRRARAVRVAAAPGAGTAPSSLPGTAGRG